MSERYAAADLARVATVTERVPLTRVDRNFGLPTGLYVATVGLYLTFLGLMTILFMNPELALPMVAFVGIIVGGFGLAGYWAKMHPDNDSHPLSWGQFTNRGIQIMTGHLTAGEAMAQVLVLPVLIVAWGLAIAVIVALH